MLASQGAAIQELNIVRKTLSLLKGGGLARLAYPAQVIKGKPLLAQGSPICHQNRGLINQPKHTRRVFLLTESTTFAHCFGTMWLRFL